MSGCHQRMGDVWVPDRAVMLKEILASLDILKEEYKQLGGGQQRLEVALTGALLVCGYTAALRGKEIPLVDIGMIQKHWDKGWVYKQKPHVPLAWSFQTNKWRVKNIYTTTCSNNVVKNSSTNCIGRAIEEYHTLGVTNGPIFCTVSKGGEPRWAMVSHLDKLFHNILKSVQFCWPEVIPVEIKVDNVYSVRQSLQRGATTKSKNCKIPILVIESSNQWKKHV
ncbi:hypothetical protein ACA910_002567 [Epithemia clementina (nom. ined.)]